MSLYRTCDWVQELMLQIKFAGENKNPTMHLYQGNLFEQLQLFKTKILVSRANSSGSEMSEYLLKGIILVAKFNLSVSHTDTEY